MYLCGSRSCKLMQNVVTNSLCSAGGEGGDVGLGKIFPQTLQLAVVRTEFMSPFGDAVGFVDGEKRYRNIAQPGDGAFAGQSFGGDIQQAKLSFARFDHHLRLFTLRERAVQDGGGDSHLCELRYLILHQRNERRNHDRGFA